MEEKLAKDLKNIPKENIKQLREFYKQIIKNKISLLKKLDIDIENSNYDENIKGFFKEAINTALLVFSTIKKGDCINSLNLIRKVYESILTININYYSEIDANKEIKMCEKRDFYIRNTLNLLANDNEVDESFINEAEGIVKPLFVSVYSFLCDFVHVKGITTKFLKIQSNKYTNKIFKDIVYINLLGIVETIEGLYNQMNNKKDNNISMVELFIGILITSIDYFELSKENRKTLKEFYREYSNLIKSDKKLQGYFENFKYYSEFFKSSFDEFKDKLNVEK